MPTEKANTYLRLTAAFFTTSIVAGLFLLASQPGAGQLFPSPWDKLAHLTVFSILAATARLSFPKIANWKIFLAVCTVGIADEVHQYFIPGRTSSIGDVLADFAGSLIGVSVLTALQRQSK